MVHTELEPNFGGLCDDAKIEINLEANAVPKFRNWCMENDIIDTVTYGLTASEEGEVVKNITNKFIKDITTTVSVGEKAKYVFLWKICREAMARGDLAGSHAIDDGKAMSLQR